MSQNSERSISMDGLIIKKKWIDKILSGKKTLEIRGSKTQKTNRHVYILESGSQKVRGKCSISCCIPIDSEEMWEKLRRWHCVDISYEELLKIYKKPYAWFLENIEAMSDGLYYEHPKGAVIWIKNVEVFERKAGFFL